MGEVRLSITAEAEALKARALAASGAILAVTDADSNSLAVDVVSRLKKLAKQVEASRTEVKAPVIKLGRDIDAIAAKYVAQIDAEVARIEKTLIRPYVQAEAEKAERSRRLAESLAEKKRQREQAEARAADEERQRLEKEAAQATNAAEALELNQQAAAKAQQAEAATQRAEDVQAKPTTEAPKAEKMTVRKVTRYEVVDVKALYAARPTLCTLEASAAAINAELRGGMRECPGLRIWEEIDTTVRT